MTEHELLDTSKKIIHIPSTSDNPFALAEVISVIEKLLHTNMSITIEKFEKNGKPSLLAYRGKVRPKTFDVILNGHVDVVPAQNSQFTPQISDGKLYGRGALDMKVAALVMSDVFVQLVDELPYDLGLQIVTDEEVGGHSGTLHQIKEGVNAKFVIAGEFTKPSTICVASRGICWARVHIKGEAAHSAYLWQGENALLLAQKYTEKLLKTYPVPKKDTWATTANLANIQTTNKTLNRVPDTATIELDIRYVANDSHFASRSKAITFLESLVPGAEVELLQYEPCHEVNETNPHVQQLAQSLAKETSKSTEFIRKHGAADVRFYSARGIPAVVLGLQGEGLHGDDEYVEVASLARYRRVIEHFLRSL